MGDGPPQPLSPGSRIGFIGLGRMGLPMARRLRDAGYAVRAFDVARAARASFSIGSGGVASAPAAVGADADAVVLMVPSSAIVQEIVLEQGLLAAMPAHSVLLDMGSSDPLQTQELAADAARLEIQLLDAPVSGGVAGAVDGSLTIMAGGPPEHVAACRPLLGVLGQKVIHAGPVGAGHALKAINNLLSAMTLLVSAEALEAGKRFGLDPNVMLDAINGSSGRSFSTEIKLPRFVLTGTYASGFSLQLMLKDMRTAIALGEELGAPFSLGARAAELWATAARELPNSADHTEIARWVAEYAPLARSRAQ